MKLSAYLAKAELSYREFGERVGVSAEAVRLWACGKRCPRLARIVRIKEVTGGAVAADDFDAEVAA